MSKKINRLERKKEREAKKLLRNIQNQKQKENEKNSCDLASLSSEINNDVGHVEETV
jgi:hypothetical protein